MFEQVNNNTTTSGQQQDIFPIIPAALRPRRRPAALRPRRRRCCLICLALRPCGPATLRPRRPCGPAGAGAGFVSSVAPAVDVSKQQRPAPGGRPLGLKFLVDQV
jgi:hypothetical protein